MISAQSKRSACLVRLRIVNGSFLWCFQQWPACLMTSSLTSYYLQLNCGPDAFLLSKGLGGQVMYIKCFSAFSKTTQKWKINCNISFPKKESNIFWYLASCKLRERQSENIFPVRVQLSVEKCWFKVQYLKCINKNCSDKFFSHFWLLRLLLLFAHSTHTLYHIFGRLSGWCVVF